MSFNEILDLVWTYLSRSTNSILGVIIALLGRSIFPEEKIKTIVTRSKRTPEAYLLGYNACDGRNTVTEIAKVIGVSQPTVTPILKEWENQGIIYEIESLRGKSYMKLYNLSISKEEMKNLLKRGETKINKEKEAKENVNGTTRTDGENTQEIGFDSTPDVGQNTGE